MPKVIWLASYRKSGNTWVRLFLAALEKGCLDRLDMRETAAIASSRALLQSWLCLGTADLSFDEIRELRPLAYRALAEAPGSGPFLLKVHEAFARTPSGAWLFPPEASAGCVHIVRDPRDVCLSLAAHNQVPVDRAIAIMAEPDRIVCGARLRGESQVPQREGSWSTHGASWLDAPLPRLLIRYEDLVAEPLEGMAAIAAFCGLAATREAIAQAVAATAFARLRDLEAEQGFRERPAGMTRFFREGRPGQWRSRLTEGQADRLTRDHGAVMRRLGYATA